MATPGHRAAAAPRSAEDGQRPHARRGPCRAQHGRDELARVPIEDQQRVVHVLAVVAVVGPPLLLPMGRIVRAVQIQQDVGGHARLLPLAQVDLPQRLGQPVAVPSGEAVLQAGEGGLAGQVGIALRQPATDQLQQRIAPQGVGVVLVGVAGGNLVQPLPQDSPAASAGLGGAAQARRGQRLAQAQSRYRPPPPSTSRRRWSGGHRGNRP